MWPLLGDPEAVMLGATDVETVVDVLEHWVTNLSR